MKKFFAYFVSIISFLVTLISCNNIDNSKTASIIINLGNARTIRTYGKENLSYYIISIYPKVQENQKVDIFKGETTAEFTELEEGIYSILVEAFDNADVLIADGKSENINVEADKTTLVTIEMTPKPYHIHDYSTEWSFDENYHWYVANCEHTDQVKDKAEHTFDEWNITTQPTEESEGKQEKECSICGYKIEETIPMLNHTHTFETDFSNDENYHWYASACGHNEVKDKAEHIFDEWNITTQPTEESEGKQEKECSICGYKIEETIAKLEHVHTKGTHHEAVAGTCVEKGTVEYYDCTKTDCEIKLDDEGNPLSSIKGELDPLNHESTEITWIKTETTHKETYDCCRVVKTEEVAHTFDDGEITTTPTTESEGVKTFTCTICGYTKTESLAKVPEGFAFVEGGTIVGSADNTTFGHTGVFVADRTVTLSNFYMGKTEVTQKLYKEVMESDTEVNAEPSYFNSDPATGETQELRPVDSVSWYDAVYFCNKLSARDGLDEVYTITDKTTITADHTKNGYRLPTEAEWEYAARGGKNSATWNYEYAGADSTETDNPTTDSALDCVGWYKGNSDSKTHEVAKKTANALGLYDMCGNVWEWCYDWYNESVGTGNVENPMGASGEQRVGHGGSWAAYPEGSSVGCRCINYPLNGDKYLGFRVCRSAW